jgi:hypothetical protein
MSTDPKTEDVLEFPFQGITLKPTPDQFKAWSSSAGDVPVSEWLAGVADDAAVRLAYHERTFPIVITLTKPVQFGSQTIEQLSIREGRAGDLKGVKIGGELAIDTLTTIVSRLAGQPPAVIERLCATDAGEVNALALDFYGQCLGAGRKR